MNSINGRRDSAGYEKIGSMNHTAYRISHCTSDEQEYDSLKPANEQDYAYLEQSNYAHLSRDSTGVSVNSTAISAYDKLENVCKNMSMLTVEQDLQKKASTTSTESRPGRRSAQDPLPSIRISRNSAVSRSPNPLRLSSGTPSPKPIRLSSGTPSPAPKGQPSSDDESHAYATPNTWVNKPWFHGSISRGEGEHRIKVHALEMIAAAESFDEIRPNTFLIRTKQSEIPSQPNYALTVTFRDDVTGKMMVEHHIAEQARRRDGTPGTHFVIDGKVKVTGTSSISELVCALMCDSKGILADSISGRPGAPLLQNPCPRQAN